MFVSAKRAIKFYNVDASTLRDWANKGKIKFKKTEGGHRRYLIKDTEEKQKYVREKIVYARVSSYRQKADLERQIGALKKAKPDWIVVKDIGSGINYKRRGFQAILDKLFKGRIEEVLVAHKDRFTRLDFSFFQWVFSKFDAKLTVLYDKEEDAMQELSKDLISIITVFTSRYYGRRKYADEDNSSEDDETEVITKSTSTQQTK